MSLPLTKDHHIGHVTHLMANHGFYARHWDSNKVAAARAWASACFPNERRCLQMNWGNQSFVWLMWYLYIIASMTSMIRYAGMHVDMYMYLYIIIYIYMCVWLMYSICQRMCESIRMNISIYTHQYVSMWVCVCMYHFDYAIYVHIHT